MKKLVLILSVLMLGACTADWWPLSFGELEGNEVAVPDNWSHLAEAKVIQFETNPDAPYSVNLWVVAMDNMLYVHSGDNKATWIHNMENAPEVRLGYEGKIYSLMSEKVTDAGEYARFAEVYKTKYGNHPRNMDVSQVYIYRLVPRLSL